jgi:hypothetical protein
MFQTKAVEKTKTNFMFNNFFFGGGGEARRLKDNVEKQCRARQASDGSTARVHCMLDI